MLFSDCNLTWCSAATWLDSHQPITHRHTPTSLHSPLQIELRKTKFSLKRLKGSAGTLIMQLLPQRFLQDFIFCLKPNILIMDHVNNFLCLEEAGGFHSYIIRVWADIRGVSLQAEIEAFHNCVVPLCHSVTACCQQDTINCHCVGAVSSSAVEIYFWLERNRADWPSS